MIVYGAPLSPFVRKTVAFAAEKGVAVELKVVRLGSTDPDFLAVSPFRKMPGFRDGDFTISDSTAIVTYIEAKHPEPALIPAKPKTRARTIWFDEFADTILTPVMGKIFFNRVVAPRFLGRDGDLAAADGAATTDLPPLLDYLEGQVPDSLHLVEDRITLADIAAATVFVNLDHGGFALDEARHPKVAAFAQAILARPSFAPLIERERRFLARAT